MGDITTGLIGYWALDGNADDSSASGINGTPSGTTNYDDGQVGQAWIGAGANHIDLGAPAVLNTALASVACYVFISSLPSATQHMYMRTNDGLPGGVSLHINSDNTWGCQMRMEGSATTGRNVFSNTTASTGVWTHVAGAFDGSTLRLYINGTLQTSTFSITDTLHTVNLTDVDIGRRTPNGDRFFVGLIDELRVYDRVLVQDDVTDLVNFSEPAGGVSPAGIYYRRLLRAG